MPATHGAPRTTEANALPTDYTFTGQKPCPEQSRRVDADAGLMYYNARYYDYILGRFISADTLVPSAANPQALNRYAYVLNNPVKYVDPTGHCVASEDDERVCARDENGHIILGRSEPRDDKERLERMLRAQTLKTLASNANATSLGMSSLGVMIVITGCKGGPKGCVAGEALYQPLNNLENLLGLTALFLTFWGDVELGDNSLNLETGEISIGQDTIATAITAIVGAWSPEAFTDEFINLGSFVYDGFRSWGWIPDLGPIKFKYK